MKLRYIALYMTCVVIQGYVYGNAAPAKSSDRKAVATKVGFIDMQTMMQNLSEYRDANSDLQRVVEERARAIEQKQQKLERSFMDLEKKKGMMKEDAIVKEQRMLFEMRNSIDLDKQELQAFIQSAQEMLNGTLQQKISDAVERIRKKQGWDAIMITPFPMTDQVNVTLDVVDLLNREYEQQKKKQTQKELPAPTADLAARGAAA